MDNKDFDSQRPRKKASRETIRKRQLIALCVIALLVLILILLIAKACSAGTTGGKKKNEVTTTTTITATTTTSFETTTAVTTTEASTEPANTSDFKLDKYSFDLKVGDTDMPMVQGYPEGSGEWNEQWSSSDENVATVDEWGNIKAIAEGTCFIILRDGGDPSQEVQIKVTVSGEDSTQPTTTTDNTGATEPQSAEAAEAPAPSRINVPEAHYEGDTLIVNKSFALPATYDPKDLDPTCKDWFYKLASGAAKDGVNIYLSSGYRSYDYQNTIYNNYVNEYGTDTADTFSARPGHSEHQTGLAIDVNTIDDSFAGTPEAIWLAEHCWEYGFIIRYPQGKQAITGYKYEPWHIRYVGSAISKKIHEMGDDTTLEELYGLTSQYES